MTKRSVLRTRLLAPVGLLAAAGIITGVLSGHSGATGGGHPRLSDVAAALPAPAAAVASPAPSAAAPTPTATATPTAAPTAAPTPTPTAAPSATPAPAPVADAALRSAVAQAGGALSVAVTDLTTGQSLDYGAPGHAFATASIVKVDILATLLLRSQDSGTALTSDQQDLAAAMIENSDNDSATALWNAIGQDAGLNAANRRFGLTATTGGTDGYWGLTSTTAADQAQLLRQVFTGDSLLSAASRGYLQQLLDQVESDQRWGVSAAATGGTPAVKDGWLPRDADGLWVINSIGTVERGGHRLLIAVVSDGNAGESDGISLVQSVAQAAAAVLAGG
ncbi:serine hydrolase [Kitasatospora sp. NPDC089797]|uniref:serine hydrolase n=1 Tax=Kitasatospora sp. NPDC089797 TaxID=3155298 RepID=UPI00341AE590